MTVPRNPDDMTAPEVLQALAFCRHDYTNDITAKLNQSLQSRGYQDQTIRSWREQFLLSKSAKTKCRACREPVIIEYEELVNGSYICPYCEFDQEILYNELDRKVFAPRLIKSLAKIGEVERSADSRVEITDENLLTTLAMTTFPV